MRALCARLLLKSYLHYYYYYYYYELMLMWLRLDLFVRYAILHMCHCHSLTREELYAITDLLSVLTPQSTYYIIHCECEYAEENQSTIFFSIFALLFKIQRGIYFALTTIKREKRAINFSLYWFISSFSLCLASVWNF